MTARKPTAVKKLAGTLRADRVNVGEPQPSAASTRCPRNLPESAKGWWRRVVPQLGELGLFTELDIPAGRDLVTIIARLEQCERLIEERGILVEGRRGGLVRNPAIAAANQYRAALQKWASKFGMTPADRAILDVGSEDEEPSLAEILFTPVVSGGD